MFADRAFHGRSGFPAAAVHAYSPTNGEMLTRREEEKERGRKRERERGGKGGRGGEIGEWKVKEGRTRANVRLHLHGGGT